jgi:protein involved in plasmid replication-relaxation
MRLTTRDREIVRTLERCKWLTTSQIQRLFFPGVSFDPVRKRMRKLSDAKFVQSYQQHHMSEMLHGFGKPPKQIEHLIGINDIRLAAEKEGVAFFYSYWELPAFGWDYPVIPDAVCKIGQRLHLVEYDTGTETLAQLQTKFAHYACFDFEYALLLCAETEKRLQKLHAVARQTVPAVTAKLMDEVRGEKGPPPP